MAAHHRKAIRELESLGYTRTEDVPGFPVWKMSGHGPVAIDVTSNKAQMDTFIAGIRRSHQKPPKPDTDVVSKAEQDAWKATQKARRQSEHETYIRIKDLQLGGAAKGQPEWVVDQVATHAQRLFDDRKKLMRQLSCPPNSYVAD
jgi:hypothetical protein